MTDPKPQSGWTTDFAAALETAKNEKKVVLADFTGSDWCGWCVRLKEEVFDTPEFKEWAAKNVVLVELDYPRRKTLAPELRAQNDELARRYGIHGYPTIAFLEPSGKPIGAMGYEPGGPANWTRKADQVLRART